MIADLTVIAGPMFAGKTSHLIARIEAARGGPRPVVIVKPAMDRRHADTSIVAHDGIAYAALPVAGEAEVYAAVAEAQVRTGLPVHLFADEVQFLEPPRFTGEFHGMIHTLLVHGHEVTCAGLDLDWRGFPFDVTARLLAMADHVVKLTARCALTGEPARKSYKRTADCDRIVLGAAETYEPRANAVWQGVYRSGDGDAQPLIGLRTAG